MLASAWTASPFAPTPRKTLRDDLYRFTAVILTNITETDQEPATGPEY
ncbi:hypothetical protein ABZ894_03000 [Nocardia beijingensis]